MRPEQYTRLNPKANNFDDIGHSTKQGLTALDIAAALHKLTPLETSLLFAYYCQNEIEINKLSRSKWEITDDLLRERKGGGYFNEIFSETLKLSNEKKWQKVDKGKNRLRILTKLALYIVIQAPVCSVCNGTKYKDNKLCPSCKGHGSKRINAVEIAKALEIDESTYRKCWAYKLNGIVSMIQTMIHEGDRKARL